MNAAYPVLDIVASLKSLLQSKKIVILQAPPGAGKSTILPLQLINEAWLQNKKIIMLEPRRLAARSVAERISFILGEKVGNTIGYSVRMDTKTSSRTKIHVVTEGILTRMIQADNSLEEVGLLIFDEFHERSIHADLSLAMSLQIQQVLRTDLRILIMSATLDADVIATRLDAPVLTASGRQYPVQVKYAIQETQSSVSHRAAYAIRHAIKEEEGDILVFLPGAGEIRQTYKLLHDNEVNAKIFPLYGDLPFDQQQQALLPDNAGNRKIILSTSIAETSLTIEGIRIVIDVGLSRVSQYNPRSGLTKLETIRVTKDAADQRAGRAGRLGPGVCYRLWTAGEHLHLLPQRKPEILEADLTPLMLELAQWGIKHVDELTWITVPPQGAVSQAKQLLEQLGAINNQSITTRGREMLHLPAHPRIAHMLLESVSLATFSRSPKILALATDIAAILEERDPLTKEAGADLTLRIEVLRKWRSGEQVNADAVVLKRIEKLAGQWRKQLSTSLDNSAPVHHDVGLLLIKAYPERLAQQQGKHSERYKLANGRIAKLVSFDPLVSQPWLSVAELDAGSGEGKIFTAAPVDVEPLKALAQSREVVRWDKEKGMVVGTSERYIGALVLESKQIQKIDDDQRRKVLCEVVQQVGLKCIGWNDTHQNLRSRILSLRSWRPEEEWPDLTEEHLLETVHEWLPPFLVNVYKETELARLDLYQILLSMLPWHLQSALDFLAPTHLKVPSGSSIKVIYFNDARAPVIEVRLQEVFGLAETPTVNEGKVKVLLHLLSPGYKPVQVTQDLKSFWQTAYHEVRKQLRMRYPKHFWPEDPWTAEAVRGVKRKT